MRTSTSFRAADVSPRANGGSHRAAAAEQLRALADRLERAGDADRAESLRAAARLREPLPSSLADSRVVLVAGVDTAWVTPESSEVL